LERQSYENARRKAQNDTIDQFAESRGSLPGAVGAPVAIQASRHLAREKQAACSSISAGGTNVSGEMPMPQKTNSMSLTRECLYAKDNN
jgi:hypothetical protein